MGGCVKRILHKDSAKYLKRRDLDPRNAEYGGPTLRWGAMRLVGCESPAEGDPRLGATARRLDLARVA